MKLYKFSELSKKSKNIAVKEYISDFFESRDIKPDPLYLSHSDAWGCCEIDLEDEYLYNNQGKFIKMNEEIAE